MSGSCDRRDNARTETVCICICHKAVTVIFDKYILSVIFESGLSVIIFNDLDKCQMKYDVE